MKFKKLKKRMPEILLISLACNFWFSFMFVQMFYIMLFNQTPKILLWANIFDEFWFEFVMFQVILIITIVLFISIVLMKKKNGMNKKCR